MLIEQQYRVSADVSELTLIRAHSPESVLHDCAAMLWEHVKDELERNAIFPRETSQWVTIAPITERLVRRVEVTWCPNPSEGVEFRGGPADGAVRPVRAESDGRPAVDWAWLPENGPLEPIDDAVAPDAASIALRPTMYRRAGIDSEHDRWVYLTR